LQADLAQAGRLDDAARAKLDQMNAILNQMRDKVNALGAATPDAAASIRGDIVKLNRQFNDLKRSLRKGS
jgi:F0F1-type ATP synthase membrane subunit b/b'